MPNYCSVWFSQFRQSLADSRQSVSVPLAPTTLYYGERKADAKTQKPAVPVQTVLSIDCDRQVNLIENTREVKNF